MAGNRIGSNEHPPGVREKRTTLHTAILQGVAVLFYSTPFVLTHYSAVDSREYETVRLRRVFSGRQPMTALDAELLQSSVSAIHCHNDGSLNIKLKNGQVIGKE